MKFSAIVAPLAFATSAVATWGGWNPTCLNDADVQSIISREIVYLEHKNLTAAKAAAASLFTPDFNEYGDSINSLRGAPVSDIPIAIGLPRSVVLTNYVAWHYR